MKVAVYPADRFGCGHFRLIWVSRLLADAGHDVHLMMPDERDVKLKIDGDRVAGVLDVDADVVVFQRLTHDWMAQAVPLLRAQGRAVVVDVDDHLGSIHPRNPAYDSFHPRRFMQRGPDGKPHRHCWSNLTAACRDATLVTVSTPALIGVYAKHGRGHVLYNYLPDLYDNIPHTDSADLGWPAALASHPDDPGPTGGAVARLVAEGSRFRVMGDPTGVGAAFGLMTDPEGPGAHIPVEDWPRRVGEIGVGMAPLADTLFNECKSWLKPLEMSALGVPWVASPRAEYARLHRMGAGVLAERPRAWYRELSSLVHSEARRAEMSAAGLEVAAGLRLADHAWRWMEAWERAYAIQTGAAAGAVVVA